MTKSYATIALLLAFSVLAIGKDAPFHRSSVLRFAGAEEGRQIITEKDEFISSLSAVDRQIRCQKDEPVSQEQFLQFLSEQVQEWSENEIRNITSIVEQTNHNLERYRLPFPKIIYLVKTSGKEESGACYTRQNAVFIPEGTIAPRIFVHELFHVLSRSDAELRLRMYETIGFHPCFNEIRLTEERQKEWKFTNPDSPQIRYFINTSYEGKPVKVVPYLYPKSTNPQQGVFGEKGMHGFIEVYMLAIEEKENQHAIVYDQSDQTKFPLFFVPDELENFWDQIGHNTDYFLLQPDEILAENFTILINRLNENIKTPRIIEEMRDILESCN